ncbi:MAG: hypothetical protein HOJ35_04005 [Bdellovibrionales bacterium]|jgi:hypothetical protein|nr:hypothetical protein [Bdellovibrionales bacterium]
MFLSGKMNKIFFVIYFLISIPALRGVERSMNQPLSYDLKNRQNLIYNEDDRLLSEVSSRGSNSFSISYFLVDNYKITDSKDMFEQVFKNGDDSINTGYLILSGTKYLYRGWVDFTSGVNLGVSFSSGNGYFESNTVSNTNFKLWSIPVDLSLGMDVSLGRFIKVGLSGGPSAMMLLQSRDDMEQGEESKRVRQFGYGYFGTGKAMISLSNIFTSSGFSLYSERGVSQMYLTIEARYHKFGNFQDEITNEGLSYGLGLSFDYL